MAEGTHFQKFAGRVRTSRPSNPKSYEVYYDATNNAYMVYDGTVWRGIVLTTSTSTTTTSTSTSTTTTSTSTTTTSTSTT